MAPVHSSARADARPVPEVVWQYAWLHRRFGPEALFTTDGHAIQVIHPGQWNHDAGPDFLQAVVKLGELTFRGHVELHVAGSDWYAHGHHQDPAYNAVILHVVAEASAKRPLREDGTPLPECVVGNRVSDRLLARWYQLQQAEAPFPCANLAADVAPFYRSYTVEAMGLSRLQEKVAALQASLSGSLLDWDELVWQQVAAAFGGKTNKAAFLQLAQNLPFAVISRNATDLSVLEALLFGAAGLLPAPALVEQPDADPDADPDAYIETLRTEWAHQQAKHHLKALASHEMRFGRMRPAGFPTIRLAQLAAWLHTRPSFMELVAHPDRAAGSLAAVVPSTYWVSRYRFGPAGREQVKGIGPDLVQRLQINGFIPISLLYHQTTGDTTGAERALEVMGQLPPENNTRTKRYTPYGFPNASALQSQGLLHLADHFCTPKRCAACGIGHQLLKSHAL